LSLSSHDTTVVYISVDVKHKFTFKFTELLKHCSQRIYLLRRLRSQGLSIAEMNMVFLALLFLDYFVFYLLGECSYLLVRLVGLMLF